MYNNGFQYNSFNSEYALAQNREYKALNKNASKLGFLLILYLIFIKVFGYIFHYIMYFANAKEFTLSFKKISIYFSNNQSVLQGDLINIIYNIFVVASSAIVLLIIARVGLKISLSSLLKFNSNGIKLGFKTFPFALLLNYIMTTIASVITFYFARIDITIPSADFSIEKPNIVATLLMFSYTVVIAPLVEEFIYRGLVIKLIRPYGKPLAVFLSAFIFGLMHGNLSQFLSAFLTGLVYATLAVYTGSIVPTILMHVLNNFINFLYLCANDYNLDILSKAYYLILVCSLFLGIMSIFLHRGILKKRFVDNSLLSRKRKSLAVLTSIPMIIYFIILTYDFVGAIFTANL